MPQDSGAVDDRDSGDDTVSMDQHDVDEARWQLPETTLPGPATKGDVLVLTKARLWGKVHACVQGLWQSQGQGSVRAIEPGLGPVLVWVSV